MIKHYFTLDGVNSDLYGVYVSKGSMYDSAERDVSVEHLFGRNGDLLSDNGCFLNRSLRYDCWMVRTFKDNFNNFRSYLMSHADKYYKIKDTMNPDYFHLGRVSAPVTPTTSVMSRVGEFTIQFDCKPQYFREDGDTFRTVASQITNPTAFNCRPVLRLTGKGTCTINGYQITVASNCPYNSIVIDCEDMDAYDAATGVICNNYVTIPLDNIELKPGANTVSRGNLTIEIKPRWFEM